MRTFVPKPDAYQKVRKKLVIRYSLIVPALVSAVLLVEYLRNGDEHMSWWYYLLIFGLVAAFVVRGVFTMLKKVKRVYAVYSLTITDFAITREQEDYPPLTIPISEVRSITKHKTGAFIIKGQTTGHTIVVPANMEEGAALEELLAGMAPISNKVPVYGAEWLRMALPVAGYVCLLCCMSITDQWFAAACGIVAAICFVWCYVRLQRSTVLSAATKRRGHLFLVLAIVSLAYVASRFAHFAV